MLLVPHLSKWDVVLILIQAVTYTETIWKTYCCDDTRVSGVIEAHPVLVVRIFSLPQEVLMAYVAGMFIDHPAASFHLDRVAVVKVGTQVWLVCGGFTGAALKVSVIKESDLQ